MEDLGGVNRRIQGLSRVICHGLPRVHMEMKEIGCGLLTLTYVESSLLGQSNYDAGVSLERYSVSKPQNAMECGTHKGCPGSVIPPSSR